MRSIVALLWVAGSLTALGQANKAPAKMALRSGEVISCHVDKGCTQEMVNGQRVFTMDVDGLTVRATLGQEQRVSFADLTISNAMAGALDVKPEDFRIEVDDVKYKRLSYVDPAGGRHAFLEPREEQVGHGLPPPDYWTSVEHKEAKEARLAAESSKVSLLPMGAVAAGGSVSGRVYFERPKGTTDRSLILPFQAAILEFPFPKMEKAAKKKGGAKKEAEPQQVAAPADGK